MYSYVQYIAKYYIYIYTIYRYSVTYILLHSDTSKNLKIPEQKYIN